jgi:hypothetical protein
MEIILISFSGAFNNIVFTIKANKCIVFSKLVQKTHIIKFIYFIFAVQ